MADYGKRAVEVFFVKPGKVKTIVIRSCFETFGSYFMFNHKFNKKYQFKRS